MCLFASSHSVKDAAAVLGCDAKTFRKVFSREVKYREIAMLIIRSGMMATLVAEAEGGSVSAIKHLDKMLAAEKMRVDSAGFADKPAAAQKAAAKPKGLKETRRENAYTAGVGDDEWGTLLHGSVPTGAPN